MIDVGAKVRINFPVPCEDAIRGGCIDETTIGEVDEVYTPALPSRRSPFNDEWSIHVVFECDPEGF